MIGSPYIFHLITFGIFHIQAIVNVKVGRSTPANARWPKALHQTAAAPASR